MNNSLKHLHSELDRIFDDAFRGIGISSFGKPYLSKISEEILKPTLDLGATENEYTISVEIPGVDENDIKLEMINDTLTIRGEKKHEKEEKEKNYYRVERSYG